MKMELLISNNIPFTFQKDQVIVSKTDCHLLCHHNIPFHYDGQDVIVDNQNVNEQAIQELTNLFAQWISGAGNFSNVRRSGNGITFDYTLTKTQNNAVVTMVHGLLTVNNHNITITSSQYKEEI